MVTGTGSGSEQSASVGGSTDDNLIGSFSEGAGFDGGDSTEVCNVLSWQLVVSQLSSAQATPLSHLTCLRSSLYSLSKWVLPAEREGQPDESKERTNGPEGGGGGSANGWLITAELVQEDNAAQVRPAVLCVCVCVCVCACVQEASLLLSVTFCLLLLHESN